MARMKNIEIVMMEWAQLVADGVLQEDESLFTYKAWKDRGFQVRKGEKAIAKFPIWNYSKRRPKENENGEVEEVKGGYFYMKMTSFFCDRQVDPIDAEGTAKGKNSGTQKVAVDIEPECEELADYI